MTTTLKAVKRKLKNRKLDAILITQPQNRYYLSGYTSDDTSINESSGVLLVPAAGRPLLLTDFRYQLQAEAEAEEFEVRLYWRGLVHLLKTLLPELKIRRLAFESHYMLYSGFLDLEKMADKLQIELVAVTDFIERMRLCKNEEELEKIARSVALNEKVFQTVLAGLKPGRSEKDVAREIEATMLAMGADRPSFDTIVASGPNGALPHAVPTDRKLKKGEPIIIDMGLVLAGYCSDMTRTVVLGEPDPKTVNLIRLVRKAQKHAIKALKAGETGARIDKVARDIISQQGYGNQFGHGLGHGVGLAVHEAPSLSRRYKKKLKPGMVVTVEPGIYLAGWGGIRLENMAVVEENGCRLLNTDTTFLDI